MFWFFIWTTLFSDYRHVIRAWLQESEGSTLNLGKTILWHPFDDQENSPGGARWLSTCAPPEQQQASYAFAAFKWNRPTIISLSAWPLIYAAHGASARVGPGWGSRYAYDYSHVSLARFQLNFTPSRVVLEFQTL